MKFKIPSVSELTSKTLVTAKRFPLVLTCAFLGTVFGIWYADLSFANQRNYDWLSELIAVSFLGVSFLLSINVYSEQRDWNKTKALSAGLIGVILLMCYYYFPEEYIESGPDKYGYRFFMMAFVSHLLVATSPFFHGKNIGAFWEYNKTLFVTILTSALYSAALFIGLSIALLSIDNLLGFEIKGERYFQLWILIVGVFNTIFFLSRVPGISELERKKTSYPKALKVFVQYVLIPLVTVYILILYSYLIKIIVQWQLPNGWVANLVLSFSITGILSLLLLNPIKDEVKNNWMRLYSKFYFIALVPLVILLFVSIGTRISEYGVTINRFLVATLAVWLAGIVIYFIISKSKNIKVIPITLTIVSCVISFGPMSAFSVSERSQRSIMMETLSEYGLLNEEKKVVQKEIEMDFKTRKVLSSRIEYLYTSHGLGSLQPIFDTDLESKIGSRRTRVGGTSKSEQIMALMGLEYINRWENEGNEYNSLVVYSSEYMPEIDIVGYSTLISNYEFSSYFENEPEGKEWYLTYDESASLLKVRKVTSDKKIDIELKDFVDGLMKNEGNFSQTLGIDKLSYNIENEKMNVRIVFERLNIDPVSDHIKSFNANILISEK
jgi:hypothetical protein